MNDANIGWNFDNSYTKLPENFFTRMSPLKVNQPQLVLVNAVLAKELGLNLNTLSEDQLAQLFSGNALPKGAEPICQAYSGHQFGQFTYLGDGRAHLIGEHITPSGKRLDIQLKGSGKTPYGRRGDGRAALEPMLREYVISEAMHALNIPTTRSLAVVLTGEPVYRETILPGAVLTRVASSHIRVGSFEYFSAQHDRDGLKQLADYVITRHFDAKKVKHPYLHLLTAVMETQADLIVDWMRVGFIHGVMNTDNMALSGETIDYGPCAFMDAYHPETVFSSIDVYGRYSYINQPVIAQWNLARFAETLLPLLDEDKNKSIQIAAETIHQFPLLYQNKWLAMMRRKLGLLGEKTQDKALISDLLSWMTQQSADFTNTFKDLNPLEQPKGNLYACKVFHQWYARWQQRLSQNNQSIETSKSLMKSNNPVVIPRNHKVNQALNSASQGDLKPVNALLTVLQKPYQDRYSIQDYQSPPTPEEQVRQTFCGT